MWDKIWINIHLATMVEETRADDGMPYGAIENAALAVKGGKIVWLGRADDLPDVPNALAVEVIDGNGAWMTPALIDCHTHLVFGGDRSAEFEARLSGASYEEISRAGGGIIATVNATRAASEDELYKSAAKRLACLCQDGVGTVEIKSGYGLDTATEIKMLRVARKLGKDFPVRVRTTFLGAHALPPEFTGNRLGYIDSICHEMIPKIAAAGLADAVDGFCENIGFTAAEMAQVFAAANAHDLPIKLHAEQLSDQGGARLAANLKALSVDHLEHLTPEDVTVLAQNKTVAVLLPGAFYILKETKLPPIDALREKGVAMALATDANPGSSPILSLLTIMNMGCTLFALTPEEALCGVTRHAAKALGLSQEIGTLEAGKIADLALWDIERPASLAYWMGAAPLKAIYINGTERELPHPC